MLQSGCPVQPNFPTNFNCDAIEGTAENYLATDTELLDDCAVTVDVGLCKVLQDTTALTDEKKKTTTVVVVVWVALQVCCDVIDTT